MLCFVMYKYWDNSGLRLEEMQYRSFTRYALKRDIISDENDRCVRINSFASRGDDIEPHTGEQTSHGIDGQKILLLYREAERIWNSTGQRISLLLVCNDLRGIGSSFTRNTPSPEKALETGISSRMRVPPPPSRNLAGGTRSFRYSTSFIYLFFSFFFFFSFSTARIESSLHSRTRGQSSSNQLRNYDGNHSSIRECCTNMSVAPSLEFPS